jgi:predicted nucleotidyltransferase
MPIPELNENGLLPEGVHEASMDEMREAFGRFQRSDRRPSLFAKLAQFMAEVRSAGVIAAVIVNGSFVTSKDEPSDVDMLLVLHDDHDFDADPRPFEYNLLSKRRVQRRFRFDVLIAREGSEEYRRGLNFFHGVKGEPGLRKGVVKVQP